MFFDANEDLASLAPGEAARGGFLGPLESLSMARETFMRTEGVYSLEHFFLEREAAMLEELREQGHTNFQTLQQVLQTVDFERVQQKRLSKGLRARTDADILGFVQDFPSTPRQIVSVIDSLQGEGFSSPEMREGLKRYNQQFARLEGAHPARGMARRLLDDTLGEAGRIFAEDEETALTTLGQVGYFFGSALGAADPRTDPFTFFSLPFGGAGKTAAGRIVSEGLVQAGIETGLQVGGAQDVRRELGLPTGFGPGVQQVAMAGVFGGVFQGLGEGAFAVGRKLRPGIRETPDAPTPDAPAARAPEVLQLEDLRGITDIENPYGTSGLAGRRAAIDAARVQADLDSFEGLTPLGLRSTLPDTASTLRGSTALTGTTGDLDVRFQASLGNETGVRALVARVDPELSRKWETLIGRRAELRAAAERTAAARGPAEEDAAGLNDRRVSELSERVHTLLESLEKATKKAQRQKIRRALDSKRAQLQDALSIREEILARKGPPPTDVEARIRQRLLEVDGALRDLAPAYTRAVAAGRGDMNLAGAAPKFEEIISAHARNASADELLQSALAARNKARQELQELMRPVQETPARGSPPVRAEPEPRALEEIAESADELQAEAEVDLAAIKAQLIDGTTETVNIDGHEIRLDGEKFDVPIDDEGNTRKMTAREMLEDIDAEDEFAGAFTVCRVSGTA